MKRILLLFLLAIPVFAESGNISTQDDLLEIIQNQDDYIFLDVRTPGEYSSGHIPGADNISHQLLPEALPEEVELDSLIILYCRSGNRSSQARRALERAGYTNVWDFGGINKWQGSLSY